MSEKGPSDMDIEELRAEYLKFFPQATPDAIAEQGEKFDEAELKAMNDRLQKKDAQEEAIAKLCVAADEAERKAHEACFREKGLVMPVPDAAGADVFRYRTKGSCYGNLEALKRIQFFEEKASTLARLWDQATPPIDLPGAAFCLDLVGREAGKLLATPWAIRPTDAGVDIGNVLAYRLECSAENMVLRGEVLRLAKSVVEAGEDGRPHLVPISPPRLVRDRIVVLGMVFEDE